MVIHELPRRVLVSLTQGDEEAHNGVVAGGNTRASPRRGTEYVAPRVLISDYLFPGEGAEDACESLSNILGVTVADDRVMECSESAACE